MPKHYRPPGKKKEGNAAKYITRTKAVHHLQVSLPTFRKLCILKGIFPREPKKKVEGNHKTYYHMKDIAFLAHDPLVEKFRDIKTHKRKVKKALARKNRELADRLLNRPPTYKLDRLILERYPTFVDALRDLDDCLTMVHLFAALPAVGGERIQVERIHNCRRLSHEWQAYICQTHSLRKTFISVKGLYYQAEVEGQKITWLTPHVPQQVLTDDVDFNVMLTFLEFYEALLGFVNFKLYHSINVKYPPLLDPRLEALAAELYALCRYVSAAPERQLGDSQAISSSENEQSEDQNVDAQTDESDLRLAQLQHQLPANEPGTLMHLVEDATGADDEDNETKECKNLFKKLKFFLSREVPRESLLFIIPAFGGVVSWEGDGSPFKESDEDITHQIVDRPTQGHMFLSREYVQPQWVYDCINARIILPTEAYLVGRWQHVKKTRPEKMFTNGIQKDLTPLRTCLATSLPDPQDRQQESSKYTPIEIEDYIHSYYTIYVRKVPPPHLSPFVDNETEGYVPEYAETIKRLQVAASKQVLPMPDLESGDLDDPQNLLAEGIIDRAEASEAAEKKRKLAMLEKQYHDELNMELQGITYSASLSNKNLQSSVEDVQEDAPADSEQMEKDTRDLSMVSMSRKKRRLYEAMQISKERKKANVNILNERKKKAQASKKE